MLLPNVHLRVLECGQDETDIECFLVKVTSMRLLYQLKKEKRHICNAFNAAVVLVHKLVNTLLVVEASILSSRWSQLLLHIWLDHRRFWLLLSIQNRNVVLDEMHSFEDSLVAIQLLSIECALLLDILFLDSQPGGTGDFFVHVLKGLLDGVDLNLLDEEVVGQQQELDTNR